MSWTNQVWDSCFFACQVGGVLILYNGVFYRGKAFSYARSFHKEDSLLYLDLLKKRGERKGGAI